MSRFYVSPESVKDGLITITGREAHHIIDVMRLAPGDEVVTFDGSGKEYLGVIRSFGGKSVVVEISKLREKPFPQTARITLIQAVPKKDKMDYVVEKASELGVGSIVPVMSGRCVPDWDGRKMAARVERWRKIAIASSKQCGRADIPEVADICGAAEAFRYAARCDIRLIATLSDKTIPLKSALSGFKRGAISVAIGPEGDFTPEEVEGAAGAGFIPVSLGPRVLKSDTAGLAAIAIINYETSG